MRLRKQLIIASLFTLSLPWLGCQYIREVETAFVEEQNRSLLATAKAISTSIQNDGQLTSELQALSVQGGAIAVHLHSLKSPLLLDAYQEDWDSRDIPKQLLHSHTESASNTPAPVSIRAAMHSDKAWFFVDIPIQPETYYRPGEAYDSADHLRISTVVNSQPKHFRIVSSGPGQAQVLIEGAQPPYDTDHRIKAFWRESSTGYQVEFSLPMSWARSQFGIEIFSEGKLQFSNLDPSDGSNIPTTTSLSKPLEEHLAQFNLLGMQLLATNNKGAYLASSGKFEVKPTAEPPWFMRLFYDFALGKDVHPPLADAKQLGRAPYDEVQQSLSGEQAVAQYQYNNRTVSVASVAILNTLESVEDETKVSGALVAIQNTNSLTSFTDSALNKLLMYSVLLTAASALSLALYATWLSYRIVQLRKSANSAISENGQITRDFKTSKINDEIGDLSRSFSGLLGRLHEYTDYLKTLSNKLSHELRTPLAIVSSSLDNLEQQKLPDTADVYVERAKSGTQRLSQILSAMGAASRVEQAITTSQREALNLAELLPPLINAYSDVYAHARFDLDIEPQASAQKIEASTELFVQMLDKLIDNAVDFCTPDGAIQIRLTHADEKASDKHDTLMLSIANPGPLIPEAMNQQIFDSMVSLRGDYKNETRSSEKEGAHHLGLGLHIAQLIACFHQGELRAENLSKSDGSDFDGVKVSIRLPTMRGSQR